MLKSDFILRLPVCASSVWLWTWVSGGDALAALGGMELYLGLQDACSITFSTPVLY